MFSNKNEHFSLFLNIKNNIYEILHIDIMLKLKDYLSTEKDSINTVKEARTKKWPDNEKDLNKEPEIKNAVDAEDVNVEKVKSVGPKSVKSGVSAKKNGTKDVWAVDPPLPTWAEDLKKFDIESLDDNAYRVSERLAHKSDFLVLGEAGWAKTSVIEQIAKKHGYNVITVYLDKAAPTDLGGIPVPDTHKGTGALYMNYSVPGWALYMADHPDDKFLLFFDEMNQAPGDVLNALMPIVLKHVVCGIQFDNMVVGAAGNLEEENATLSQINKPLRDRFKPIIQWDSHTPETWESAFKYIRSQYEKEIGAPIIDKFEALCEYFNSPRDVCRVIMNFVLASKSDEKEYTRKRVCREKVEAIIWDDIDSSVRKSAKFNKTMDELAEYLANYIKNGGSKENKSKEDENDDKKTNNRLNDTEKTVIDALIAGNFYNSPEIGGDGNRYVCTLDNVITEIFNPEETGITAEVLRRLVKVMKAQGDEPRFKTKAEAMPTARKNKWLDPADYQGFLVDDTLKKVIKNNPGLE